MIMPDEIIIIEADRTAEAAEQIARDLAEYLPRLIDSIAKVLKVQTYCYLALSWSCGLRGFLSGLLLVLILKKD